MSGGEVTFAQLVEGEEWTRADKLRVGAMALIGAIDAITWVAMGRPILLSTAGYVCYYVGWYALVKLWPITLAAVLLIAAVEIRRALKRRGQQRVDSN